MLSSIKEKSSSTTSSAVTLFKPTNELVVHRSEEHHFIAPDGTRGRQLANLSLGNMSCYEQDPGVISHAQLHHEVHEIWQVTQGVAEIWIRCPNGEEVTAQITPGSSVALPAETAFQFKNLSEDEVFKFTMVTMPPWPGAHVIEYVDGPWESNIARPDNSLNTGISVEELEAQKLNESEEQPQLAP